MGGARGSFKGTLANQILQFGAVSAWYRLAEGTVTGSGYSSVPDVLNSNPAVQATDARRPPAASSANGLPIIDSVDDVLMVPLIAGNNGTAAWGFWAWLRQPTRTTAKQIAAVTPFDSDASSHKLSLDCDNPNNAGRLSVGFRNTTSTQRGARFDGFFALNTWEFLTVEFDGSGATEAARCVVTRNASIITATTFLDLNGTPGDMPTVLLAPTGSMALFSNRSSMLNPWVGNVGPNFGFFGSKMAGATTGLLTPAARTVLMNFEAPT